MPEIPKGPRTVRKMMTEDSPRLMDKIRAGGKSGSGTILTPFECKIILMMYTIMREFQTKLGWIESPERMGR